MTNETQIFKDNLETVVASKSNYKSLKAEKRALITNNNTLRKKLQQLEKELSKEQASEEKSKVLNAENENLRATNCALQDQVDRLCKKLQGKKVLGITLNKQKNSLS